MPIWAIPDSLPPLALELLREPAPAQAVQVDDELRVEWRTQSYDLETGRIVYGGGIKATYGPTTVLADELELDTAARTGLARGRVRIIDPLGVLEGSALKFNWGERTGEVSEVSMTSLGARLRIDRVVIGKEEWVGYGVWATPCGRRHESIAFESRRVVLRPGRSGRATGVRVSLFGLKTPEIPWTTFSLDRRVDGLRLPAISVRRGQGTGVTWGSGALLNDRTALHAHVASFPGSLPSTRVELAWSAVPADRAVGILSPRTDMGERFRDSYMDRVYVRSQEAEDAYLRSPRRTLAIASVWNQGTAARPTDSHQVSKRLELVAEAGGAAGAWGAAGQARLESIRPTHRTPFTERLQLSGTLQSAGWPLGRNLESRVRLDGFSTLAGVGAFGWVRGLGTVSWRPSKDVRLSAGLVQAAEAGRPQFGFDGVAVTSGALLRADVRHGPVTVHAILKHDFGRGRSYSTEWGLSWVMGCFEPFMQSRIVPRDFQFGVRLRVDEFRDMFTRREFRREGTAPGGQGARGPGKAVRCGSCAATCDDSGD
jgi:hypothetical protein